MGLFSDFQTDVRRWYGKRWVQVATIAMILAIAFVLGMVGSVFS